MRYPVRLGVGENIFTQSDRAWSWSQPIVAPAFRGRVLASRLEAIGDLVDGGASPAVALDEEMDLELLMGRLALVIAGMGVPRRVARFGASPGPRGSPA